MAVKIKTAQHQRCRSLCHFQKTVSAAFSTNSKLVQSTLKKKKTLLYLNALSSHCVLSKKELSNDDLDLS